MFALIMIIACAAALMLSMGVANAVYVNEGNRTTYANSGSAIVSKDVISLVSGSSGRIAIAVTDIAATTGTGQVDTEGRWTLPKASGEAFTFWQLLYWDGTQLTGTSSTTFTRAGRCAAAAASSATTADVIIDQF